MRLSADITKYAQRQPSGIYRYYRRVPVEVAQHDKRTFIKVSLKTKNHKEALEKAQGVHDATERLCSAMASGNDNKPEWERYDAAIRTTQSLGFAYRPVAEIAAGNFDDLYVRSKQAAELSDTDAAKLAVKFRLAISVFCALKLIIEESRTALTNDVVFRGIGSRSSTFARKPSLNSALVMRPACFFCTSSSVSRTAQCQAWGRLRRQQLAMC